MKLMRMALLATAACGLAAPALADGPAWTYVQAGYLRADNFNDDSTDGFNLAGSLGIGGLFHGQLQYTDGTIGDSFGDTDFDGYRVIAGLHPKVSDSTHLVLNLQYFDYSYDDLGDANGFGLGAGIRHMLTDRVELSAIAWWNEGDFEFDGSESSDSDFGDSTLEIAGRYLFTDAVSVGVTFVVNDPIIGGGYLSSGDSATLDVRWQFGDLL